jgi:hypothetical protein
MILGIELLGDDPMAKRSRYLTETLENGKDVLISGFGVFSVKEKNQWKKDPVMARKSEAKKIRIEEEKNSKRDEDKSGQTLLVEKLRKYWNLLEEKTIVAPNGAGKMSEVIQDFAEPLLDECEDDESERKAISIAIFVWNTSLLPKKEHKEAIQEICSEFSKPNDAGFLATMRLFFDMLMERKKKYFANNKRLIVGHQISGSGNNRRLIIVSAD